MSSVEEKVYEIYALHPKGKDFTPEQTYVGKTSVGLWQRFYLHKSESKKKGSKVNRFIYEFGAENLEMELIERCVGYKEAAPLPRKYWAGVLGSGLNTYKPGSFTLVGKKEYGREWVLKNRETVNELGRLSYARNREKRNKHSNAWVSRNREKVNKAQRSRRARDRGKRNEWERGYWAENKDRIKALQRYRYALKNGKRPRPEDVPLPTPDKEGL